MILVDVNLLLYAYNELDARHLRAKAWWASQLSGEAAVCLDWIIISGFLRILTNTRIFKNALTRDEAVEIVALWLKQPCVRVLTAGEHHWETFSELVRSGQASGNLMTDAHIAALAINHGCELQSTDADFSRFPKLKWRNPLK